MKNPEVKELFIRDSNYFTWNDLHYKYVLIHGYVNFFLFQVFRIPFEDPFLLFLMMLDVNVRFHLIRSIHLLLCCKKIRKKNRNKIFLFLIKLCLLNLRFICIISRSHTIITTFILRYKCTCTIFTS